VFPNHVLAPMTLFWHLISEPVWQIVPNCNIGVALKDKMIDVFQSIGNVMGKKIAKTAMMSLLPVLSVSAKMANTNVKTKIAL